MLEILIGIAISVAVAYWISTNWAVRGGVFVILASIVGGYGLLGSSGLADQPMSKRLDELRERDPKTIQPDQWIALLQERAKQDPADPQPHKFIGDMLMAKGMPDEAVLAYQSALRRDPQFFAALMPMADAMVQIDGGRVSAQAEEIYRAIFKADSSNVKAGFMPGMRYWLEGDRVAARQWWQEAIAMTPEGSDARLQLVQQVEMLEQAMANVGAVSDDTDE